MKCHYCEGEIPDGSAVCAACGRLSETASLGEAGAGGHISATSGLDVLGNVETGVSIDAPSGAAHQSGATATGTATATVFDSQIRRGGWIPKRAQVEAWGIKKELNHYEVLELDGETPDEALTEHIKILEKRLDKWAGDPMDAGLQKIGSVGLNRLFELKRDLADRAAYNLQVKQESHASALRKVRAVATQCVEKDKVLQWNEWKFTLLPLAEEEGVSRDELEAIIGELKTGGALTGINIAGREVRTALELKDVCDGDGDPLVEVLWNGELERWLEDVSLKKELADEARLVKAQYADNKKSGAQRILWKLSEKRFVLITEDWKKESVVTLKEWVDGVYNRGLENASLQALKDRRLENWLMLALNQDRLAAIATAERENGLKGLWRLIWETGERGKVNEESYRRTKALVEEYPKFWEAQYQHAVHCAATRRTEEMRTHLRQAIKGDNAYATRALNDADLQKVKKQVLPLVKEVIPIASFKFKNGEAFSVPDLIGLCDEFPDEAVEYLYNDYLERWLAEKQGEGALASRSRSLTRSQTADKRKGLEFFVRELCEAVGLEPYPQLETTPKQVNLGAMPIGAQTTVTLQLKNTGRGHAWGKVSLESALPGLSLLAAFVNENEAIVFKLDTLRVEPGKYQSKVLISAEGVPKTLEVPFQYQVTPLQVQVDPPEVKLGTIMHGSKRATLIKITCTPPDGRLTSARRTLNPVVDGVSATGKINGSVNELKIEIDTTRLQTGRQYETNLRLETNVGPLEIPIQFKTSLFWKYVVFWRTAGVSLAVGLSMFLSRWLLAQVEGLDQWFFSYQSEISIVLATGAFGALVLAIFFLGFRHTRFVQKLIPRKLLAGLAPAKLLGNVEADQSVSSIIAEGHAEPVRRQKSR